MVGQNNANSAENNTKMEKKPEMENNNRGPRRDHDRRGQRFQKGGRGGFRGHHHGGQGRQVGGPNHHHQQQQEEMQKREEEPIPTTPSGEKKFTGRCRLFVGNLTPDVAEEEFKKMFQEHGEISEVFLNTAKGFGFIRLDTRHNAEAAKAALDGTQRKGRTLRVRFATHGAALKVKYIPSFVSNELLEEAFSQFGQIERAICIVDDRGRPTGEGIVEFARKPGAQQALNRINEGVFLIGSSPRPLMVEPLEQRDEEDGLPERFIMKNAGFHRERENGPRFAGPNSFEYEFAQRWKELYRQESRQLEQAKQNFIDAGEKLEMEMESAQRDHQAMMLRQDLMRRQEELRQLEEMRAQDDARRKEMEIRRMEQQRMREEETERREEMMRQQQQEMRLRGERTGMDQVKPLMDRGRRVDEDDRRHQEMMRVQQEEMRRRQWDDGPSNDFGPRKREGNMRGEMQNSPGPRGNQAQVPPPPAPPASMGLDRPPRQQQGGAAMGGNGGGNMGGGNNMANQMRQSRFDQPPSNFGGGQGGPLGGGNMGGPMGRRGGPMMDRNRGGGPNYDEFEAKRPRRF